MTKGKLVIRLLAASIDLFLVFLSSYMIMTMMGMNGGIYTVLPQLLFAVYNVVAITAFEGKTIGKYFAQISVYTEEGGALHLGIREVGKLLYFVPVIGLFFVLISLLATIFFGKTLHDWIGKSQVLLDIERKKLEKGDYYEEQLIR